MSVEGALSRPVQSAPGILRDGGHVARPRWVSEGDVLSTCSSSLSTVRKVRGVSLPWRSRSVRATGSEDGGWQCSGKNVQFSDNPMQVGG